MNIVVCIKQVPSGSIPMDDRGNLDRSQGGTRLNPGDLYALEAGLSLAETTGGTVTVLTMGPSSAEGILKTAFSMGVSRGVLLCDRAFAGSDVYATGYALSQAIRALGGADVVICGQQSTDGDTAQLPSSLGMQLGIPVLGWVKALAYKEGSLLVSQELSTGTQQAKLSAPCLLAVGLGIGVPRIPTLRDQLRAQKKIPEVMTLQDLPDSDPQHYGIAASPTRVAAVKTVEKTARHSPFLLSGKEGAGKLLAVLQEVREDG